MTKQQTITINGVAYDAHTGMRIADAPTTAGTGVPVPVKRSVAARSVHTTKASRSQTLSRRYVKAPAHKAPSVVKKPQAAPSVKSPMVTKFAKPSAVAAAAPKKPVVKDMGPVVHPKAVAPRATTVPVHHSAPKRPVAPAPAAPVATNTAIKNHAIHQAMERAVSPHKTTKKSKHHRRLTAVASAGLAITLLAGYLTYVNMPSLSVQVAAAQAGIAASYPSHQPTGYSLQGPVAYEDGQVTMKFSSNTNSEKFTLNQSRSTWDSSALLDNYVQQASNGKYQALQDSGLTIYTYGNDAAWVNGGVLHTISGDAQLSDEQVRQIATSM